MYILLLLFFLNTYLSLSINVSPSLGDFHLESHKYVFFLLNHLNIVLSFINIRFSYDFIVSTTFLYF